MILKNYLTYFCSILLAIKNDYIIFSLFSKLQRSLPTPYTSLSANNLLLYFIEKLKTITRTTYFSSHHQIYKPNDLFPPSILIFFFALIPLSFVYFLFCILFTANKHSLFWAKVNTSLCALEPIFSGLSQGLRPAIMCHFSRIIMFCFSVGYPQKLGNSL